MHLIRLLVLDGLKSNRRLHTHYIASKANSLADALSHNQMSRFRMIGSHMNEQQDVIDPRIFTVEKVWLQQAGC